MPEVVDPGLVAQVREHVVGRLRADVSNRTAAPAQAIDRAVREVGGVLGDQGRAALVAAVRAELEGAGALQPLIDDPTVSDVLVNGPREVWVDRGRGLVRVDVDLGDPARLRALAVRLAAAGGQRLDDAAPVADARLPDGSRLHAVLAPVAGSEVLLSIRVLRRVALGLDELVAAGSLTPWLARVLRGLVDARANLLVSGATGTGKTTLLGSLLSLVPSDERIVCIEEAGELVPDHPHVVRLLARRANVEGAGEVDLAALVRHALRMRPDRIVLGECRGAEVREVLTALNTGHAGGCATVHANAVEDVPARLEALGALAGMDRDAVAAQAASAVDAVVHLRRAGGLRHVAQVGAVTRGPAGDLLVVPVLARHPGSAATATPRWPAFAERWGLDPSIEQLPIEQHRIDQHRIDPHRGEQHRIEQSGLGRVG